MNLRASANRGVAACAAVCLCLALAAAAVAQPAAGPAPVPAGAARIWVYRDIQSSMLPTVPLVRFNGAIAGAAYQGGAFYRDVPPGAYHITVDSVSKDFNQDSYVVLAAGQQAFIQILQLDNWDEEPYEPLSPTFYAWLRPPAMGYAAISRSTFYGGGPLAAALR
jgi:hypothetical protein